VDFSPAYHKVHTDPGFGYLSKIAVYPKKNTIDMLKFLTYCQYKNEQLEKNPAIFCFRQMVDKRP
jgi:hypothetical protein